MIIPVAQFTVGKCCWLHHVKACLRVTCFACSAKDLIRKLLVVNPKKRLTAEQALQHPWLVGEVSSQALAGTQQNLKKNYASKFRKAVNVVRSINIMKKLAIAEEDRTSSYDEQE